MNLLVDVTYGIINPRIRQASSADDRTDTLADVPGVAAAPPGPLREFWGYFRANHGAVVGLVVVDRRAADRALRQRARAVSARSHQQRRCSCSRPAWQAGGSWAYPLGTDAIGRDILSRLIYGARLSLLIGIVVVALSIVVGIALGLVAGLLRAA